MNKITFLASLLASLYWFVTVLLIFACWLCILQFYRVHLSVFAGFWWILELFLHGERGIILLFLVSFTPFIPFSDIIVLRPPGLYTIPNENNLNRYPSWNIFNISLTHLHRMLAMALSYTVFTMFRHVSPPHLIYWGLSWRDLEDVLLGSFVTWFSSCLLLM